MSRESSKESKGKGVVLSPAPGKNGALEKKHDGEAEGRKGWLSWVLGWVALPAVVIGGIIGGGVLVGANFHESWFTRVFVWVFS